MQNANVSNFVPVNVASVESIGQLVVAAAIGLLDGLHDGFIFVRLRYGTKACALLQR